MGNWTLAQILAGEANKKPDQRLYRLKRELSRLQTTPIRMMRVYYVQGAPRAVDACVKQSQWFWSYSRGCRGIGVVEANESAPDLQMVDELNHEYVNINRKYPEREWERWCDESRPVEVSEERLLQKEKRLMRRVLREVKGAKEALYESLGGECQVQYEGRSYEVKTVESRGVERVVVKPS